MIARLIALICVALNTVAAPDATAVVPAKILDAVLRFFSFCLPMSVLSFLTTSEFADADVIVPAIPVVAPIVSSVGTVAAAGLAIDGYYNLNKGRNGLK